MQQEQREWISTGEAARLLGYRSASGFRLKFTGIITHQRIGTGHFHWNAAEVLHLRGASINVAGSTQEPIHG